MNVYEIIAIDPRDPLVEEDFEVSAETMFLAIWAFEGEHSELKVVSIIDVKWCEDQAQELKF